MRGLFLSVVMAPGLWAATAEDLLAQVHASLSPADLRERGSRTRAEAIEALRGTPGLSPADRQTLALALAEAWLEAQDWAAAQRVALEVFQAAPEPAARDRAGSAWLAAWVGLGGTGDPVAAIAAVIMPGPRLTARALVLRAETRLAAGDPAGLADLDAAVSALVGQDPAERVPLLVRRLTASEALAVPPAAMAAWRQAWSSDPALALAEGEATGGLIGRPAPPLEAPRRDGGGEGVLSLTAFRGDRPVLVAFVATWSEPCAALPALVSGLPMPVLWVAIDGPETLPTIPAWATRLGLTSPVIGEGRGWEGDLDDTWRIEQIPALALVDAQGRLVAVGDPATVLTHVKEPAAPVTPLAEEVLP